MKQLLKNTGKYLLHVLLPRTCAGCGRDLHFLREDPLCPACCGKLEPVSEVLYCKKCGLPLKSGGEHCYDCRGSKAAALKLDHARAAFVFNEEIRALIHSLKYRGKSHLAPHLGRQMSSAYDKYPELKAYNFAIAVPLYPAKERERGFNQSALLAGELARERKLFLLQGAVERVRDTPSQTALDKDSRRENMQGAFRVAAPELVKGRRILIIDDVATTLATAGELATELRKAGAKGVALFTLAREP